MHALEAVAEGGICVVVEGVEIATDGAREEDRILAAKMSASWFSSSLGECLLGE